MNNLKSIFLALIVSACYFQSSAQAQVPFNEPNYNKRKIFTDLPERMALKINGVEGMLNYPVGASVDMQITSNFRVTGKVVSKADPSDASMKTVVVKLNNRENATFTFTRTKKQDGSFAYLGRVLNKNNGDALEIVKENGQYVMVKKSLYDLMSE